MTLRALPERIPRNPFVGDLSGAVRPGSAVLVSETTALLRASCLDIVAGFLFPTRRTRDCFPTSLRAMLVGRGAACRRSSGHRGPRANHLPSGGSGVHGRASRSMLKRSRRPRRAIAVRAGIVRWPFLPSSASYSRRKIRSHCRDSGS